VRSRLLHWIVRALASVVLPIIVGIICLIIGWQRNKIAKILGLVDRPNFQEKLHNAATPVVGGLMFLVCAIILIGWNYGLMIGKEQQDQRLYLIAAIVLAHSVLGITDDRYSVPAAARLSYSLSLVAAVLATDRTMVIRELYFSFGLSFGLGSQASYFLTVLFVVGFIYAVNMMDGLNGILGVYGLILLGFFSLWLFIGNEVYFLCAVMALTVFLAFNLAGVLFAGDGGSYLLGASAGVLFLALYDQTFEQVDMIAVAAFVPVIDAFRVSIDRLRRGGSMFLADRNHLHHILGRRLGPHKALLAYSILVAAPMAIATVYPAFVWLSVVIAGGAYAAIIRAFQLPRGNLIE
jgi:UDP-GlcNAc:undecaprenyl-phosphate/decaprenyl-phosphate GlcNAc-1-phosphate transferase